MRTPGHDGEPLTVSAILAFRWYDEIEAGRKRTEYRDISPYWTRLLWTDGRRERVKRIKFSRGYTKRRMTWTVTRIDADKRNGVYQIHLGSRIE